MRGGEHKSVEKRLKKVTPNLLDLDMESMYHQVFDMSALECFLIDCKEVAFVIR